MLIAARQIMLTDERPVEVGWIATDGNVVVPVDWAFTSDMLTAKHTLIGAVSGVNSDYTSATKGYLVSNCCLLGTGSQSNRLKSNEGAGFCFCCEHSDRRNRLFYGKQGWWNAANADNYTFNVFHTFEFQHSSTNWTFMGIYKRDGTTVSMYASDIGGNASTSYTDATFQTRPCVIFNGYYKATSSSPIGYAYPGNASWKFGGWKIELNNQVLHEYVPAIKGKILGVWDKVTGNFFNPEGTGQLSYGSR